MSKKDLNVLSLVDKHPGWCERRERALRMLGGGWIYLPVVIVIILMFGATIWQVYLPSTDPARYQCYALFFWQGGHARQLLPDNQCAFLVVPITQAPFKTLPIEYPPLTLVPFSLPLLAPAHQYQIAFAVLMSLVVVVVYWLLIRYGPCGSGIAFLLYLVIGAFALVLVRFDLLPALSTLCALIAADRKRWTLAYLALASGILIKIYPVLLLPALFLAEQQERSSVLLAGEDKSPLNKISDWLRSLSRNIRHWNWWNCLLCLGCILGVTALFSLSNFYSAVVSPLSYFMQRPLQVESAAATVLWLDAHIMHIPWHVVFQNGSLDIINSTISARVSPFLTIIAIVSSSVVFWLQWSRRLPLTRVACVLMIICIATGKVFSPQYVLWVIPLLVYGGYFTGRWLKLWTIALILTTFIYIYFYSQLPGYLQLVNVNAVIMPAGFFEVVAVRSVLFLALAGIFIWQGFFYHSQDLSDDRVGS